MKQIPHSKLRAVPTISRINQERRCKTYNKTFIMFQKEILKGLNKWKIYS